MAPESVPTTRREDDTWGVSQPCSTHYRSLSRLHYSSIHGWHAHHNITVSTTLRSTYHSTDHTASHAVYYYSAYCKWLHISLLRSQHISSPTTTQINISINMNRSSLRRSHLNHSGDHCTDLVQTPVESNKWFKNWLLSLPSQALGIVRIGQGLVHWVSGMYWMG